MRIYLDQIGCRLNYAEMHTLGAQLRAAGHTLVAQAADAQVVVFNSCAVTADAERSSRQRVRQLHTHSPQARIAVTGCWSTLRSQEAAALPGVALVVDNERKEILHTLLEPWSAELESLDALARLQPDGDAFAFHAAEPGLARTRAFVKVQDGCDNRCTFCIVTLARGAGRSRTIAEVVAEVQAAAAGGAQEAVLTGVHLGSFGRDLRGDARTDLKTLVQAILMDTDIPRLRLSSLEPWELADGFFDLWPAWPGRLCPHLHLPLQAGSDAMLRRMARRCTIAGFRRLVETARAAIPDLIVTTDLIAGFPGESEAEFARGAEVVAEMRFAHAHVFPFSARPGTAAASFPDQIAPAVRRARVAQLQTLVEQTGRRERLRFVDTARPVLWEGRGRPLADSADLLWTGHTDNYLRVAAPAPAGVDLHNRLTATLLSELNGDTLYGTIVPKIG